MDPPRRLTVTDFHLIGFFSDLPHGDPDAHRLRDSRAEDALDDAEAIGEYLAGGHRLNATMDYEVDPFDGEPIQGGASAFTDGRWIWPKDFIVYFPKHQLRLPPAFLSQVRSNSYQVPAVDTAVRAEAAAYISDLYSQWFRQRRGPWGQRQR